MGKLGLGNFLTFSPADLLNSGDADSQSDAVRDFSSSKHDSENLDNSSRLGRFFWHFMLPLDRVVTFLLRKRESKKFNEVLDSAWGSLVVGFSVIALFFGFGGLWAVFAPIDGSILAPGAVVVASDRKVIQSQDGGTVEKVMVADGQKVSQGQTLVVLNHVVAAANYNAIRKSLVTQVVAEARLLAIKHGSKDIFFPDEVLQFSDKELRDRLMSDARDIFTSYRAYVVDQTNILDHRIKQLASQVEGVKVSLAVAEKSLGFSKEDFFNAEKLSKEGYLSESKARSLAKVYTEDSGRVGSLRAKLVELDEQVVGAKLEKEDFKVSNEQKISDQLSKVRSDIDSLREREKAALEVLQNSNIVSPSDGVIMDLSISDGVSVLPGREMMEVVPVYDRLVVDAKMHAQNVEEFLESSSDPENLGEIDGVKGLKVKLRLLSYNARKVGMINGIVERLSADVIHDQRGFDYYDVRVIVPKSEMQKVKGVPLYPGMPVQVYMVTGSRVFLWYLMTPFIWSFGDAFHER